MPFTKGDPNINRGGRPKGSANRIAEELKEAFAMVLEDRLPDLNRWLGQVAQDDPAKAIDLMIKLSNRFLPELARTELTGKDGADLFKNIKFDFGTEDDQGTETTSRSE